MIYTGTKAKLVLSRLLDKSLHEECSGYFYDAFFNNWVGFDNSGNRLLELEFNSEETAKTFANG